VLRGCSSSGNREADSLSRLFDDSEEGLRERGVEGERRACFVLSFALDCDRDSDRLDAPDGDRLLLEVEGPSFDCTGDRDSERLRDRSLDR
jgi:hypothetical protein